MTSSTIDFFDQDIGTETHELRKKLDIDNIEKKQSIINTIDNFSAYQHHRNDLEIRSQINQLQYQAERYIDMTQKQSYNSFPSNYLSKLFELGIFQFLNETQKLNLCEKTTPPDFKFEYDSIEHHVECVTCTSSLMDEVYKQKPNFHECIKAAKILIDTNSQIGKRFDNAMDSWAISILINELDREESLNFKTLLQADTIDEAKKSFLFWLYLMRYSRLFFNDVLSETERDELDKIKLPNNLCGNGVHDIRTRNWILHSIVRSINEKSKKSYFKDIEKPITLAVSFSLNRDFLSIPNPGSILSFACENLYHALENGLSDAGVINNLYAIIIDTSWYNWFYEIAKKRHNAVFPEGYNNCYGCIYNLEHPLVKSGLYIYDKIPYVGYFSNEQSRVMADKICRTVK